MEHERYEDGPKTVSNSKCEIIPFDVQKSNASLASLASMQNEDIVDSQNSVNNFASPTPEKALQPSRSKNKGTSLSLRAVKQLSNFSQNKYSTMEDEAVELFDEPSDDEEVDLTYERITEDELEIPDKYKTLAELFDSLHTSVRLLNVRKKLPTFQNICTAVEVLSKRKFSLKNLAQITYMLPEAIEIKKILIHDEKTLCMVPDIKVTLLLDTIEVPPNQSPFIALRRIFRSRLVDFSSSHLEGSDIPEIVLPEPFTKRDHSVLSVPLHTGSSVNSYAGPIDVSPTASAESEPLLISSTVFHSIRRHFCQKLNVPEAEKTQLLTSNNDLLPQSLNAETNKDITSPQQKEYSSLLSKSKSIASSPELIFSPQCSIKSSPCQGSPVKSLSLAQPLTIETPAQPTPPKRTLPSSDDKINTESRMLSAAVAKRSLDFSLFKGDENALCAIAGVKASSSALSPKVEHKTDTKMSQTGLIKRQQMLDLFNMIQNIFLSVNCSMITKQELLQKIIAYKLDVVETREAEKQLQLLEELVPDWISQKLSPGGDLFYSIQKPSNVEFRAKLAEAI